MEKLLRRGRHEPLVRRTFDIRWELLEPGRTRQSMNPPAWARLGDDCWPGLLALLADSTLGSAISSTLPAERIPVTQSLRIDLLPVDMAATTSVTAQARQIACEGSVHVATGELADAQGHIVALASLRSVAIDIPPPKKQPAGAPEPTRGARRVSDPGAADPDSARPLWARHLTAATPRFGVIAGNELANAAGQMHGGISIILTERAARAAAIAGGHHGARVSSMTADFIGPMPCDGSEFTCTGELEHHRGSTLRARGTAVDARGRDAVIVSIGYHVKR